jgi:hypothetical protein
MTNENNMFQSDLIVKRNISFYKQNNKKKPNTYLTIHNSLIHQEFLGPEKYAICNLPFTTHKTNNIHRSMFLQKYSQWDQLIVICVK